MRVRVDCVALEGDAASTRALRWLLGEAAPAAPCK